MKIYTKTGDKGQTSLFGGRRVTKDSLRIEAYGLVDELNSLLGLARSLHPPEDVDAVIEKIQHDLFVLGADLATPPTPKSLNVERILPSHAAALEPVIDRWEAQLKPLREFILPGGSSAAAQLHVARTVCRRAERLAVKLSKKETIGEGIVMYLNRLSDLLFVAARLVNRAAGVNEIPWRTNGRSAVEARRN